MPPFIRVLSGVLHVDEEHAHFSKDEILQIRRDVLQMFYIKEQREDDLKRARIARDLWATWFEVNKVSLVCFFICHPILIDIFLLL